MNSSRQPIRPAAFNEEITVVERQNDQTAPPLTNQTAA